MARRIVLVALLALLLAGNRLNLRAASSVDDPPRKDGDLFVGGASVVDGYGNTAGGVWRVRGGQATLFCQSPESSFDPGFWNEPISLIVDARGRVVFLAPIGGQNFGLLRCDLPGAPAEMLAALHARSAVPAGWPVPFPDFVLGDRIGFLHIVRERAIHEDFQSAPQVVNEDAYEFVAQARDFGLDPTPPPSVLFRYGADSGIWQSGWELPDLPNQNGNLTSAVVHGDSLWSVSGSIIRRTSMPLTLKASGTIGGTDFTLTYGLFGGVHEVTGAISDNTAVPNVSSGCNTDPPGLHDDVTDLMPLVGGGFAPFGGEHVYYDEQGDLGLVFTTGYGPMPGPYLTHVASALLNDDANDDHDGYFHQPFDSCRHVPWIQFSPILPWNAPDAPALSNAADVIATAPGGMVGTQFWGNQVVRLTPGDRVTPIVALYHPTSIAAYPAVVPSSGTVVYITIHSPVDVLVTDASGRRLGVDPATGAAVNDFGQHGFDSGAGEPRVLAIENPAPGAFALSAVGTGNGAYRIDVSAADFATGASSRVTASGTAVPAAHFEHDFTLDERAAVSFDSVPPPPDTAPPMVTCAAADDVWHAGNVALPCTAGDDGSGLANPADANFTLQTSVAEGVETDVAATDARSVCDAAGNCAAAGPIGGNRVDRRPPAIHISIPASATFLVGETVSAAVSCEDGGSGVATCAAQPPGIDTSTAGTRSLTVHAADIVGNAASASAAYSVRFGVQVLFDEARAAKSGSTLPIAIGLLDASGRVLQPVSVVATGVRALGSSAVVAPRSPGNSQPAAAFTFDAGVYQFNLKTTGLAAGSYELLFSVAGQPGYAVTFMVR